MTSQQVWCFLPTTALLFFLSVQTFAEVMESVSDCDHFFLDQTPPHVPGILEGGRILNQNRYKLICQTYKEQKRFVTLYDVQNRIPVFSAFKFTGEVSRRRPNTFWKIEPQLENPNENNNMIREDKNRIYNHQAGDVDYRSNGTFDRGHLFPSSYASTEEDKVSTFTLTNVVPQAESFNKGSWNKMERCTKCIMEEDCVNDSGRIEGFVVTGALPSSDSTLNNRVNVPAALWSAFCCYSAKAKKWIASEHWGYNVQDKSKDTVTLEDLQHRLLRSNFNNIVVFPGPKCYPTPTIRKFYPETTSCPCPLTIPDTTTSVSGSVAFPPPHRTYNWVYIIVLYTACALLVVSGPVLLYNWCKYGRFCPPALCHARYMGRFCPPALCHTRYMDRFCLLFPPCRLKTLFRVFQNRYKQAHVEVGARWA